MRALDSAKTIDKLNYQLLVHKLIKTNYHYKNQLSKVSIHDKPIFNKQLVRDPLVQNPESRLLLV